MPTSLPAAMGERVFKHQFAQFIDEATPGVYDPNGRRRVLTCLQGDFQPEEAWSSFKPDGFSDNAWNLLSKSHCIFTATVTHDFAQDFELLPLLCDLAKVETPSTSSYQETYLIKSHGSTSRKTRTLEWGTPNSCLRCTYAIAISYSQNNDRDAENIDGQIVFLCRKPVAIDVPMTSGTIRSATLTFTANGVTGDFVVAVIIANGLAVNITLSPGDTTNQTATKLLAAGVTATVTGTVPALAPVNEVQTLKTTVGVYTGGAITIVGPATTQTITPGDTLSAIQGKLALAYGATTNHIVATGTTQAASGAIADPSMNLTFSNGGPVWTGASGAPLCKYSWTNGAGETLLSNQNAAVVTNGATIATTANYPAPPAGVTGINIYMETVAGNGVYKLVTSGAVTAGVAGSKTFSNYPSAGNANPPVANTTATPGVFDLALAFSGASVSATNQVQLTSPTVGVVTDTTTQGSAGSSSGVITAAVTAPTQTEITLVPVSGANWTPAITAQGNDGVIRIPKRRPKSPARFGIRIASTRSGLDNATLAGKVKKFTWGLENSAEPVWFANEGDLSYQSHSDSEERALSIGLSLAHDSPIMATIEAYALANPVATKFWIEVRDLGDTNEVHKAQFLVSPSGVRQRTALGKVIGYDVPLMTVFDDNPFEADPVANGGASAYFILKKPLL